MCAFMVLAAAWGGRAIAAPAAAPAIVPLAQATVTPVVTTCVVRVAQLFVRAGPGTTFPVTGRLARNTRLRAVSFVARGIPSGPWVEVEQRAGQPLGFVAAGVQFVTCDQPFTVLPVGRIPPVPTVTRTPAPTPTRLPPLALVKVFGNDSEDTAIPPPSVTIARQQRPERDTARCNRSLIRTASSFATASFSRWRCLTAKKGAAMGMASRP